jgi:hypothetical protein
MTFLYVLGRLATCSIGGKKTAYNLPRFVAVSSILLWTRTKYYELYTSGKRAPLCAISKDFGEICSDKIHIGAVICMVNMYLLIHMYILMQA